MNKIYHLSTCDTCQRIIKELDLKKKGFIFQDIKTNKITSKQLDDMKALSGSYAALFSKTARKYKTLVNKTLSETELKNLILEEYTFLKRPVIIIADKIFIGNSAKTITEAKKVV